MLILGRQISYSLNHSGHPRYFSKTNLRVFERMKRETLPWACGLLCDWDDISGCQLDCIWNELQSRNGGHTSDPDLEVGSHRLLTQILTWEDICF